MKHNYLMITLILIFSVFNISYADSRNILIIETMPVKVITEHTKAIKEYFDLLNIKDIDLKVLKAEGSREKAVKLLEDALQKKKPDVVISLATLASMAVHDVLQDKGIPQVFAVVADPVGAGIIKKENVPTGTFVTGRIYSMFRKTKIDMLMRILDTKEKIRLGVIHSDYPSAVGDLKGIVKAASANPNIEFVSYSFPYINDSAQFDKMFDNVKEGIAAIEDKIDYWWYVAGPLAEMDEYHTVIKNNSSKLVAMGHRVANVKDGALMAVSPNFAAGGREVAKLALEILDGKDAGLIPVTTPENFTLAVNLTEIVSRGLKLPSDMLKLAGENVFR